MQSMVNQLQRDALDSSSPVSALLMKAKVVAVKLDLADARAWIDSELDGYDTTEVPPYREIKGEPRAQDLGSGLWVPMVFSDARTYDLISTRPILSPIGEIEDIVKGSGEVLFPFTPTMVKLVVEAFKMPTTRMGQIVHRSALSAILHAVRNRVLDWALALDKTDNFGKGQALPTGDKEVAASTKGLKGMFTAQVVKVMIASPSDISEERQAIRDEISRWNAIHAEDRRLVLLPIGWETHSAPETGNRPQAILNKQILKDCDLLVAVFWTRLGSPTGVADSGTVEEINEHVSAGKPAMIYFSDAPIPPSKFNADQVARLQAFKESLRDKCLYEEFTDLTTFREKFSRNLAQQVISRFTNGSTAQVETQTSAPKSPKLSAEAQHLLVEAAKADGTVFMTDSLGGTTLGTRGQNFISEPKNARMVAMWRGAVEDLVDLGYLEVRDSHGKVFALTRSGYLAADTMIPT